MASGGSCSPNCNDGYTLNGDWTCNNGALTTATCEPSPCDEAALPITNGAASPCPSTMTSGDECFPTCDAGYTLSGSRSCLRGTLTDTTECQADPCTASSTPGDDGSDGTFYCVNGGTIGGTTGSCTCTDCNPGYESTSCQMASACTANPLDSTKDGSDGSIHCGEHGIVGGTTGSCTCTCDPGWEGSGCETVADAPGPSPDSGSGGSTSPPEYGNCECYCGDNPVGNIDVDDRQGGVGVTQSFCEDNMRDQCPDEGFTCDGGDLTVSWSYVSTYTGANFGGGTYDGPAPSPDPGSGGGTSDELGDCSCYCDADKTDFAGNVTGCDGNGGDCGVTSAECSSLGPDDRCPSTFGQTCSTYYVEWFVNPSYSSGHSHNDSGSGETRKNCECLCDDQSWSTRVFPNLDTCSQGECGITESACSDSSAGSVYDTCTSYNQDAVDNGDSDACTGTVSTRWTYDGYSYSQGPTSSPDPGSG